MKIEKGSKCRQLCGSFHYGKDGLTEDITLYVTVTSNSNPKTLDFFFITLPLDSSICRKSVLFFFKGKWYGVHESTFQHCLAGKECGRSERMTWQGFSWRHQIVSGGTFDRSEVRSGEFNICSGGKQ